jgi:sec-independent protein translocase protein TatA
MKSGGIQMESMEIVFVLAILLFVFGPTKLPELAREIGKAIKEFKKASSGILEGEEPSSISRITKNRYGPLEDIVKDLNIEIKGKNKRQIIDEIIMKTESKRVGK